jgi:ribonuclease HI
MNATEIPSFPNPVQGHVPAPLEIGRHLLRPERIKNVYADGGVVTRNPSGIGGTWACVWADAEKELLCEWMGWAPPIEIDKTFPDAPSVSNNVTELLAVVLALEALPPNWEGEVYSDSLCTIRRLQQLEKASMNGVPDWLAVRMLIAGKRLGAKVSYTLLCGHPTKKELDSGYGKRGYPVHRHNARCDMLCKAMGILALTAHRGTQGKSDGLPQKPGTVGPDAPTVPV